MTRITTIDRAKILKAVLNHRFKAETDALVTAYALLAREVYDDVYTMHQRRDLAKLPVGWVPQSLHIKVKMGDVIAELPFGGFIRHVNVPDHINAKHEFVKKPMPSDDTMVVVKVYDATHELAERYQKLQFLAKDLREACAGAYKLGDSILEKGKTVAKLLSIWPEVKPFTEFLLEPKPKLPAMPISTLNSMLDLPVSKAA